MNRTTFVPVTATTTIPTTVTTTSVFECVAILEFSPIICRSPRDQVCAVPATVGTPGEWQEDDTVWILCFGAHALKPKPRWRTGAGSVCERPGPLFLWSLLQWLAAGQVYIPKFAAGRTCCWRIAAAVAANGMRRTQRNLSTIGNLDCCNCSQIFPPKVGFPGHIGIFTSVIRSRG